jgi:hypothetical protein
MACYTIRTRANFTPARILRSSPDDTYHSDDKKGDINGDDRLEKDQFERGGSGQFHPAGLFNGEFGSLGGHLGSDELPAVRCADELHRYPR